MFWLLFTLASAAAPQASPAPAPVCTSPAPPPPGFGAMARRTPLATGATLVPASAVGVTLSPATGVAYPVAPARPSKPGRYGSALPVAITCAGTYRIALGDAAWIDLVRDGKVVASVAHDHGPACSSVRKIVDFTLTPGRYTLQISDSAQRVVAVLIVPRR